MATRKKYGNNSQALHFLKTTLKKSWFPSLYEKLEGQACAIGLHPKEIWNQTTFILVAKQFGIVIKKNKQNMLKFEKYLELWDTLVTMLQETK